MGDSFVHAVVLGSAHGLFTIGLGLPRGLLSVLDLAHGTVFMGGAMTAYVLSQSSPLPLGVLLPATMLVAGGLVALRELPACRPIRRRAESTRAAERASVIASLGAVSAFVAAARIYTRGSGVPINTDPF